MPSKVDELQTAFFNPGARGAFAEHQLEDIVRNMLPSNMYEFQCELPNGRVVDCLITQPSPSGSPSRNIAVDAKFPLANLPGTISKSEVPTIDQTRRTFARDVKKHVSDIADRYILSGATGEYALMFIPSEAVFVEIREHHLDVVQFSQEKKVTSFPLRR